MLNGHINPMYNNKSQWKSKMLEWLHFQVAAFGERSAPQMTPTLHHAWARTLWIWKQWTTTPTTTTVTNLNASHFVVICKLFIQISLCAVVHLHHISFRYVHIMWKWHAHSLTALAIFFVVESFCTVHCIISDVASTSLASQRASMTIAIEDFRTL